MSNEQKPDTQSDSDLIEEVLEQTAELENEEVKAVTGDVVEEEEVSVAELQQQLAKAEQKAAENWDKALRIQAEMENLKRRTQKDLESAHKYGLEKFAKELLNVIDSLELGIQAATSDAPEVVKLKEGSELTIKQFEAVFDKFNIKAIDPTGQAFDPEFHQAMSMLSSADAEPNTVLNVLQKGYVLNGRLIRPAMVVVAQTPA
jgi:molecular chaperone GrpE